MARGALTTLLFLCLQVTIAWSDTVRVATFNASLSRNGPGLLLRALEKGTDPQIGNVLAIIQHIRPDIVLLSEVDFDVEQRATSALIGALAQGPDGINYPYSFTSVPNTGRLSGLDLNGDGTSSGPEDAFGFGRFPGQYGMLLLSRFPIETDTSRTFAKLLWKDLPGATLPTFPTGAPFPSQQAHENMRLSSKSHWDVEIETPNGPFRVLASHPTPPVFDGPEDRNGLRNADEIRFWSLYLDGTPFEDDQSRTAPWQSGPSIVLGDLNADPNDGDGIRSAIGGLLNHPILQDPVPRSDGGWEAGQAGINAQHSGDPGLDTADWNDDRGPGNLRVDYALPTRDIKVIDAGVFWPTRNDPLRVRLGRGEALSSDHRLVWLDIRW